MPANWKQTKTQLNQHRSRLSASAAAAAAASLRPHSYARCELRLQLRRRQRQQRLRSSLSSQVRESECEWVRCVVVCGGGLCLHACKCLSLCKTGFYSLSPCALSLSIFCSLYLSCLFDRSLQHLRCSSPAAWCVIFFCSCFCSFVICLTFRSRFLSHDVDVDGDGDGDCCLRRSHN